MLYRNTLMAAALLAAPAAATAQEPAVEAVPHDVTAEPVAPMTEAERAALLEHLERTRGLFLDALSGLTADQAAWKSAEDKWSIAEATEHVPAAESFIRGAVEGALGAPAVEASARHDDAVSGFTVDRSSKFQAPEPLQPTNRYGSFDAALAEFRTQRETTAKLVTESGDLRSHAVEHPAFGVLDAYGWTLFLSAHSERHTKQIEEIKADPGFPAG